MEKQDKKEKLWAASCLPNGIWEVLEYTYFADFSFTYRTIVRGITREQAKTIEQEHNKVVSSE